MTLAAVASLLLNVAMLGARPVHAAGLRTRLCQRQHGDAHHARLPVLLMLGFGYFMDAARARVLAAAGRRVEARSPRKPLSTRCTTPPPARAATMRCATWPSLAHAGKPGVIALFDAPGAGVSAHHHGHASVAGRRRGARRRPAVGVGVFTERTTRRHTERATGRRAHGATQCRRTVRNAETIVAMGMTVTAVAGWQARATNNTRRRN